MLNYDSVFFKNNNNACFLEFLIFNHFKRL